MSVVLPEWVARKMRTEDMLDALGRATHYWNPLLKDIDRELSLVYAKPNASGPGIRPGYWHVRRRNEKGADTYKIIETTDGGYREMGSDILERLKAGDMWNAQVLKANDDVARRREASKERDKLNQREARADEIAINVKAQLNPSVAFTDKRWSNRPAGKRGRRA